MNSPLVSICVPFYKGDLYIAQTLKSLLSQTYQNIEIIVVDDGSPDEKKTWNAVSSIVDPRIKFFKKEHNGGAAARNYAASRASGEYIAFCDQDDLWENLKLEKQVDLMKARDLAFCFSRANILYEDKSFLKRNSNLERDKSFNKLNNNLFKGLLLKSNFVQSSFIFKKNAWKEIGGFNESLLNFCEDYDLILKMAYKFKGYAIDEALVKFRKHSNNTSSQKNWSFNANLSKEKIYQYWLSSSLEHKYKKILRKKLSRICFRLAKAFYKKGDINSYKEYIIKSFYNNPYNVKNIYRLLIIKLK